MPVVHIDSVETTTSTITLSWTIPPDATESQVSWELTDTTRISISQWRGRSTGHPELVGPSWTPVTSVGDEAAGEKLTTYIQTYKTRESVL